MARARSFGRHRLRAAQDGATSRVGDPPPHASVHVAERNGAEALAAVNAAGARSSSSRSGSRCRADANAIAGQYDAALDASRRLTQSWHFGDAAQDEWLRGTLRMARYVGTGW